MNFAVPMYDVRSMLQRSFGGGHLKDLHGSTPWWFPIWRQKHLAIM